MKETHEILCPSFIECPICQTKREEIFRSKVANFFSPKDDIQILSKHFYHLTIFLQPSRETYNHFSLNSLKKVGRELINGLSSLSSVSNRKWWSLFVDSGIRFYSVEQNLNENYPIFKHHIIFFSEKDNLDVRMNTQLKYRIKKIDRHLNHSISYLGQYDIEKIQDSINLNSSVNYESQNVKKLGEDIISEIHKIKDQRPIVFGKKYRKESRNKLITHRPTIK